MTQDWLIKELFQLNVGKILALCWENSCLAPEFNQSHLQCKALIDTLNPSMNMIMKPLDRWRTMHGKMQKNHEGHI